MVSRWQTGRGTLARVRTWGQSKARAGPVLHAPFRGPVSLCSNSGTGLLLGHPGAAKGRKLTRGASSLPQAQVPTKKRIWSEEAQHIPQATEVVGVGLCSAGLCPSGAWGGHHTSHPGRPSVLSPARRSG